MPIRSPRVLVEIEQMFRNVDDNPNAIDQAPEETEDGTKAAVFCKMKKGIAEYLGYEPLPYDDPRFLGVFGGNGLNRGSTYLRNIGGFKDASYKLIAKTNFLINEEFYDPIVGAVVRRQGQFRSMSIGFPKGHSAHEFKTFIVGALTFDSIEAFVTPKGRRVNLYNPSATPPVA